MLEQMSSTTFLATDGYAATKWGTLAERVMPLKALFNDTYVSPDGSWWIPRALGPAPLLLAVAWIAFAPRVRDRRGVFYTGLALVLMLVTTELFPWETVQEQVGVIQFPWRILTFGTLFFAVGAALFYAKSAHTRVGSVAMVVVAVFSLASFAACYMPILNTFIRYKNEGVPEYIIPKTSEPRSICPRAMLSRAAAHIRRHMRRLCAKMPTRSIPTASCALRSSARAMF